MFVLCLCSLRVSMLQAECVCVLSMLQAECVCGVSV